VIAPTEPNDRLASSPSEPDVRLASSPKIELHVHLEGSIRPATLLQIARRNDEALPADTVEGLQAIYEFTDFAHFIEVWILTTNCLHTRDDFRQVVVDYAAEAASFGAVYLEGIFSPGYPMTTKCTPEDIFAGYADGAVEAAQRYGVTVRFTTDLYRGMDTDVAEDVARWSVRYADRGVVGLGIGGLEERPFAPYRRALDIARDGGLALVPHAGEAAGPASIWEVLSINPDRIRHGIRAVEDPALLREIADRGLVLDVCPTSNLRTAVIPTMAEHPLPALRAAGVQCSINTDDPAMFGTDLGHEYDVAQSLGVSPADAFAAGLAGAACDDLTRAALAEIGRSAFSGTGS
jgi:aminodeoxyfutalosine deaminase